MSEIKYLIVIYHKFTQKFNNEYFTTFEELEHRLKEIEKNKDIEVRKRFKVEELNKELWKY